MAHNDILFGSAPHPAGEQREQSAVSREVDVPLESGLDASREKPALRNPYLQTEQNGV